MYTKENKSKENKSNLIPNSVAQKKSIGKLSLGLVDNRPELVMQKKIQMMADNYSNHQNHLIQKKANNTGLPSQLKSGIENLSGISMDDVKVHYNSSKPAQLQAHAYAQGTNIHLGSGQEKHLPHEAWHVVQQKQGRVRPTTSVYGVTVNDSSSLESEADVMGSKALQKKSDPTSELASITPAVNTQLQSTEPVIQRVPTKVQIHGLTHIIKIKGQSIFQGKQIGPIGKLVSGQRIIIDDSAIIVSRRGPNQEVRKNREDDEHGRHMYEWFHVLNLRGHDVGHLGLFVRENTFRAIKKDEQHPAYKTGVERDEHAGGTLVKYENAIREFALNPEMSFEEMLEMLRKFHFGGSIHAGENKHLVEIPYQRQALVKEMTQAVTLAKQPLVGDHAAIRDGILIHPFHEQGCLAAQQRVLSEKVQLVKSLFDGDYERIVHRIQFPIVHKIQALIFKELTSILDGNDRGVLNYGAVMRDMQAAINAAAVFEIMNDRVNEEIMSGTIAKMYRAAEHFMKEENVAKAKAQLQIMTSEYSKYINVWKIVAPYVGHVAVQSREGIDELLVRIEARKHQIEEDQASVVKQKFVQRLWDNREQYLKMKEMRISRDDTLEITYKNMGTTDIFTIKNKRNNKKEMVPLMGTTEKKLARLKISMVRVVTD